MIINCIANRSFAQSSLHATVTDQYENAIPGATIKAFPSGASTVTDSAGAFTLMVNADDSISISKEGFIDTNTKANTSQVIYVADKKFGWKDLLNPLFYIKNGGLWVIAFYCLC